MAPPATPMIYSGTKNTAGRAESSLCPKGSLKDETPNHHFCNCKLYQDICVKYFEITKTTVHDVVTRGGVEDTRLEAKDNLYEYRPSRGQGQECSRPRPRTKDTCASVLQKKKVLKNYFQAISNSLAYPEFLIGRGLNHKSHEMTSSKIFQTRFLWDKDIVKWKI